MNKLSVVVTCEHGGHEVPAPFTFCFEGAEEVLLSHRGWDPGALDLAFRISRACETPLYFATTTRLLVELNRSRHAPDLFSEYSAMLSRKQKQYLLNQYYYPYRNEVGLHISNLREQGKQVLHLSIHSFTPVLHGKPRTTEIGLLFDPSRSAETDFCKSWATTLGQALPGRSIEDNQPYAGTDDGFTTALRKRYDDPGYLGIELEVRQDLLLGKEYVKIVDGLVESLLAAIKKYAGDCDQLPEADSLVIA